MSKPEHQIIEDQRYTASGTFKPRANVGSTLAFLALIVRRRRTLLCYSVVGALLGLIFAAVSPSTYESTAELMPPEQSGSGIISAAIGARGGDPSGMGIAALFGAKSSGALFVAILQSRSAQDDLIAKFGLQKRYGSKTLENARKKLQGLSSFTEERKAGIVIVSVRDHSREQAQQMCQEYISALNRLIEQDATSSARREREFLERRLSLADNELSQSEREFSSFATKNKAIDIPEETKATIEAAAALQGQLVAAEADLNGIRQLYGPDNPHIRNAEGRVALVRSRLQDMNGSSDRGNSSISDGLFGPSLHQLPGLEITYADLYRKLKIQEALYGTLTTEYEMAKVQEAKDLPTVRVLDPPNLPGGIISPRRGLIVIGFTLFATLLGCAWLFLNMTWQGLDACDEKRRLAEFTLSSIRRDCARMLSILPSRLGTRHL